MKVPKYVEKMIQKRLTLAVKLDDACDELEKWLEEHGADLDDELMEDTHGGVEIYINPHESAERIREYIETRM